MNRFSFQSCATSGNVSVADDPKGIKVAHIIFEVVFPRDNVD